MKTLVVFYSMTGNTLKVAKKIAKGLKADLEEIKDVKIRRGNTGYVKSALEAWLGLKARIQEQKKDPSRYDLVVIGTPVWVARMSSPVRTYLIKNKDKIKKTALFCTYGGNSRTVLKDIESLLGKEAVAKTKISEKEVKEGYELELKVFTNKIQKLKKK